MPPESGTAELTHLKISDIDSKRWRSRPRRERPQRSRCHAQFQVTCRTARPSGTTTTKSSLWLFPGNGRHSRDRPIDTKTVWYACHKAAQQAGIQKKRPSPHVRQCFATHLSKPAPISAPSDPVRASRPKETTLYVHLRSDLQTPPSSPLDSLPWKASRLRRSR